MRRPVALVTALQPHKLASARAPGTPGKETSVDITQIAPPARLGQPWVREVVPGVFRVGTTFLACYAVEDAGAYTFIDVGLPGYWPQMTWFLAARNGAAATIRFSAPGIPAVTPVLGGKSGVAPAR